MKTPDEIKKGLETCIGKCTGNKPHCPYHECGDGCMDTMNRNALAYIQQLEADKVSLLESSHEMRKDMCSRIQQLEKELKLERAVKKGTIVFTSSGDFTWEIERMPKWISVEERLPDDGQPVIVFATHTDKWSGHWHAVMEDCWCGGGWDANCDTDIHKVTHWMPMPEPPTEDDNGR